VTRRTARYFAARDFTNKRCSLCTRLRSFAWQAR